MPKQCIWFHGTTSKRKVESIKKNGFKKGTYFARHMEDAVVFGGKYVFLVRVTFSKVPMKWQVCSENSIPPSAIESIYITQKVLCFSPHDLFGLPIANP